MEHNEFFKGVLNRTILAMRKFGFVAHHFQAAHPVRPL
jgi:hypothetical protein